MSEKHTCQQILHPSVWGRINLCGKTAKMQHDGKWYCGIHDPVKLAARQAERQALFDARWDARIAANKKEGAIREARDEVIQASKALCAAGSSTVSASPIIVVVSAPEMQALFAAVARLGLAEAGE